MQTAYITHPLCLKHDMGAHHPESPARIHAIEDQMIAAGLMDHLQRYDAPEATSEQLLRAHDAGYVDFIESSAPQQGIVQLDGDTAMNPFSYQAALRAAGAVVLGVDLGTTDPQLPRARDAWQGIRPRKLCIPIRGNKGKTVFTDMQLVQQKDTLQSQIRKLMEVGGACYNLGDGARIEGAVAADLDKLALPPLEFDRAKQSETLIQQFPLYAREKVLVMWTNEVVRESVARFASELLLKMSTHGWTNEMITEIETICSYGNKPIRQQYAPRLLRGSLLRMFLHAHGVIQRTDEGEQREKAIEIMKGQLERHIRLIESESYGLADELESEDTAYTSNYAA